jgi:hypothetical protein
MTYPNRPCNRSSSMSVVGGGDRMDIDDSTVAKTDEEDDPEAVKVADTLENALACLRKNVHRNLIYFPRSRKIMDDVDADRLVLALKCNTSLTNLTVEETRMSNLSAIHKITEALLDHSNIQRLTFYDNRLGNEGVTTIMNVLHQYYATAAASIPSAIRAKTCAPHITNSLQALCLCGNQIGNQGAYWIAQALGGCKTIHELDLSSNEISEQGTMYLANMLAQSNLTAFILNGNQAGQKGARAIAEAVHQNRRLDVLGMCGNDIGDEGAIQIAQVAKTHPRLKAILLEDNFLGERGIMAVADAHCHNRRLGMMEVSWNFLSPIAMQFVSASISEVVYLYLDHCEIGDAHMQILGGGLGPNRSIRDLFLEGNHIGLHGVQALALALKKNKFLGGVFLDGNPITRRGAYMLRNVLKHSNMSLKRLQIHDDYHDIQREMDVYLDMNGVGRKAVLQREFPVALWADFLVHKDISHDSDLVYLFLKERPDLFQRYSAPRTIPVR